MKLNNIFLISFYLKSPLQADITIWVMDLKYHNGELKILEFEDDSTAGYSARSTTLTVQEWFGKNTGAI